MTEPGTEIVRASLSDEDIVRAQAGVSSLEQLAMVFASEGYDGLDDEADGILSLSVIGNKDELVGKPFMILRWRFNASDKFGEGQTFVSMEIAFETRDQNDNRVMTYAVLNDGSTGIRDQMIRLTEHRKEQGKLDPYAVRAAKGGLRRSDYVADVPDPKTGELIPTAAKTYYVQF
jgi:hypothetical protein